jgi:Nucleotidyltransferase of unknown function (DUF6036)
VSTLPAVADALLGIAAAMRDAGVRWYLFGAQAAILWGSPRLSADVDITVDLQRKAVTDVIKAMAVHGFDVVFGDDEFVERTRVLPFIHRSSRMPVDIVLAGPGLEEEFLNRAVGVAIADQSIPVISPDDLIVTKILAGRPKDMEDVRAVILARRDEIDFPRVRSLLRLLEEALSQTDLLSALDAASRP